MPPETFAYETGGGEGSRLVIRAICTSPIVPLATLSRTLR